MQNYNPQKFYTYFKECYKLDYKEFSLENILSTKYTYKWFVEEQEELLYEDLPLIPYTNNKAEKLEKEIELYKLEKKLFYASFFILGTNNNHLVKDNRYCAPLILHPAEIKSINEDKFLSIDKNSFTINRSVLSKLEVKNSSSNKDAFISDLSDLLLSDKSHFINMKSIIDQYFSNIDTKELLLFPTVWSIKKIRGYFSKHTFEENTYKIIPAAGTVLIQKSESSLRVINDLTAMAEKNEYNTGTFDLMSGHHNKLNFRSSIYKSRLNTDQYQALKNAHVYSNSVIVGPPGTGKTYTITSIVSDAVLRNESVLVVSKTKQAVEVLRQMLQDDFNLKDHITHTTGNRYRFSLKSKIKRYLSGITSKTNTKHNKNYIVSLHKQINALEHQFEKEVQRELKISDIEFSNDLSLLKKFELLTLKTWQRSGKILDIFQEIEELISELENEIKTYSKYKINANLKSNLNKFRYDIAIFKGALEASSFTRYKEILNKVNHQNILKVFPIWLANLSDLNSVLPLQKDMFDLVIMDEATQCDIASALPAIYRAKRVVIVGDPNQLKHYSFVSAKQQNNLKRKLGLPHDGIFDYRNQSILDLFISKVKSQEQVSFLREHFRSTPSIIEFSNSQFYDGQLEILKSTPKHTTHDQIELIETEGQRDSKGVNLIEADSVVSKLNELISKYKDEESKPSIGIISPFNAQVKHIINLIWSKFDTKTIKDFNILCGTPYNFQGSERDFILLSFGVCDDSHPSAFNHASKPEVLNVAITRAKSYQYIFKSVSDSKLKTDNLLSQYFNFIRTFSHTNAEDAVHDQFQEEVVNALRELNFDEVRSSYPVAGSILDILVYHHGNNYFIDLIGYPGMFKEAFSMERYKTLARTGIKSLPLHYSLWKKNKQAAIKRLSLFIG